MKQVKSVELFSDVTCQNCVSYNHSRCCKSLPAIPTEADNRCGKGYWLFKGEIINYRHISRELQQWSWFFGQLNEIYKWEAACSCRYPGW